MPSRFMSRVAEVGVEEVQVEEVQEKTYTCEELAERDEEGRMVLAEELGLKGCAKFLQETLAVTECGYPEITDEGIREIIRKGLITASGSSPSFEVETIKLEDWTRDLPYGALLAVKEAKEKELRGFEIHYPVPEVQSSRRSSMSLADRDPVITAHLSNSRRMLFVFAWGDGHVYTE